MRFVFSIFMVFVMSALAPLDLGFVNQSPEQEKTQPASIFGSVHIGLQKAYALGEVAYDKELGVHSHLYVPTAKERKRAGYTQDAHEIGALAAVITFGASAAMLGVASLETLVSGAAISALINEPGFAATVIAGVLSGSALTLFGAIAHGERELDFKQAGGGSLLNYHPAALQQQRANHGFLQAKALRRFQKNYKTLQKWAADNESLSSTTLNRWRNKEYRYGYTLAHFAAVQGDADVLAYMFDEGFDMSVQDKQFQTPFELAYNVGHVNLARVFAKFNTQQLRDQGSQIVMGNIDHMRYSLRVSQQGMLNKLQDIFADAEFSTSTAQPIRLGLEYGRGNASQTQRGKLKSLFVDIVLGSRETGDEYEALLNKIKNESSWIIESADEYGFTALHIAIMAGNYDAVVALVRRGLSLDATTENGISARDMLAEQIERRVDFATKYVEYIDARAPENHKLVWADNLRALKIAIQDIRRAYPKALGTSQAASIGSKSQSANDQGSQPPASSQKPEQCAAILSPVTA